MRVWYSVSHSGTSYLTLPLTLVARYLRWGLWRGPGVVLVSRARLCSSDLVAFLRICTEVQICSVPASLGIRATLSLGFIRVPALTRFYCLLVRFRFTSETSHIIQDASFSFKTIRPQLCTRPRIDGALGRAISKKTAWYGRYLRPKGHHNARKTECAGSKDRIYVN